MRFVLRRLSLLLLFASIVASTYAANPPPPPVPASFSWNRDVQGAFVVSLCRDQNGAVWIGTEDQGIWRYDASLPKDKAYTHFTRKNGLVDDNAYALVCDAKGRVWVGTLNHGVSVYNGKQWQTYAPPNGPLGLRVFALAASSTDGDIWIATEAGLTRYSLTRNTWTNYTRANGLPADSVDALAFGKDGTLYVGTQCDGMAIASPADDYHQWRIVPGPAQMPASPTGNGLPSRLINCLLAANSGTVFAGTPNGLALSTDSGQTWTFRRGADWRDKVKGLWHGPPPTQNGDPGPLFAEDYITCLAEDAAGHLWIGHRQHGLEVWDLTAQKRLYPGAAENSPSDYVTALLTQTALPALVGWYSNGLTQTGPVVPKPNMGRTALAPPAIAVIPPLPQPAAPPDLSELNDLREQVSRVKANPQEMQPQVTALADDWLTEGDWLGRYGRYWACLCATFHPIPEDYLWGAGWEPVNYDLTTGPNHAPDDRLRYWMGRRYTDDPTSLELPPTYLYSRILRGYTDARNDRRDTIVDDHGEAYPQSLNGPHVYCTLTIPTGLFTLSLYSLLRGRYGMDRIHDHLFSIRVHTGLALEDVSTFASQPELARSRLRQTPFGVWKRFLVRGPTTLTVEMNRNGSFNTSLSAVMLDLIDEDPPPYFHTVDQWNALQAQREKTRQAWAVQPRPFHPAASEGEAATLLFDALEEKRLTNSVWWATESRRYYAPLLRWYAALARQPAPGSRTRLYQHLATCCYQMGQYAAWEGFQQAAGQVTARQVEKSLRWDGVTDSYSGLGYEVVTAHLAEQSGRKESKAR